MEKRTRNFVVQKLVYLIVFSAISLGATLGHAAWTPKRVEFKTRDGEKLVGSFVAPAGKNPTVMMLHGLTASKEEWTTLAERLQGMGWGVFAYDMRGHGESSRTKGANGTPNGYELLGPTGPGSKWEKMIDDVGAALKFLETKQKIDRQNVFFAGASLGANVCLNYASLTRTGKGVLLLSPGLDYREIKTEDAMKTISPKAVLLVASPQDGYSFSSSQKLARLTPTALFWSNVKPGHGVQMLDESLLARLTEWFKKLQ